MMLKNGRVKRGENIFSEGKNSIENPCLEKEIHFSQSNCFFNLGTLKIFLKVLHRRIKADLPYAVRTQYGRTQIS